MSSGKKYGSGAGENDLHVLDADAVSTSWIEALSTSGYLNTRKTMKA